MMEPIARDRIFISYSTKDAEWLNRLKVHLSPYLKDGGITIWDATQVAPGERWRDEIDHALKSAQVALLLVSPDYLAEEFTAGGQLPALLAAAGRKLSILWIPVRASGYQSTPLASYHPLCDPKHPLSSLDESERDKALVAVCEKICTCVQSAPSVERQPAKQAVMEDAAGQAVGADSPHPTPTASASPEGEATAAKHLPFTTEGTMTWKLSASGARKTLLGIWFGSFAVNLTVVLFLYFDKWIEEDNLRQAMQQLNTCYVTYIGVMATFYLGQQQAARRDGEVQAGMSFAVALVGSMLWNLLVCAFMARLLLGGTVEDALRQIGFFGPLLSWLVAPAVGFYFGSPSAPAEKK